ncbi:hypothetical protein KC367_g166 [Hortaea werneckii]|nr:hypothetical protein KC367_g166 [Hortaea werneckii]
MVDDVLGSVGAKRVVNGDTVQTLRDTSKVYNLPFGTVLAPETDTMLNASHTDALHQSYQADTEVCPPFVDLLVCLPDIWTERLRRAVVRPVTKASLVRYPFCRLLEEVVHGSNGRVESRHWALILTSPVPVNRCPAWLFRPRNGHTVWSSRRRTRRQLGRLVQRQVPIPSSKHLAMLRTRAWKMSAKVSVYRCTICGSN